MIRKMLALFTMALMIGTIFTSVVRAEMNPPPLSLLERDSTATTVNTTKTWYDETRVLNDSLIISNGGSLVLRNVDLIMNCSYDNELVIRVEKWGSLTLMEGSTISAKIPSLHYLFEVYGDLIVDKSTIRDIGGTDPAGGVQVSTPSWGHVVFINSVISDSAGPGISCVNTTLSILGCSVFGNQGDGLYCKGGIGYDESMGNITFELFLKQGWNLISLPVTPLNTTIGVLFSGIPYIKVQSWDPITYAYQKLSLTDHMVVGRGYMVFVLNNTFCNITGTPVFSSSIALKKGWNLVGSLIYDVNIANPNDNPDGAVVNSSYALDYMGNFSETQLLLPGRGYFMLALENATLSLSCVKKSVVLAGTTFSENQGDGCYLESSNVSMQGCEFFGNNEQGLEIVASKFTIVDQNTIYDNKGKGLSIDSSNFTMSNSSVYNNSGVEVKLSTYSHVSTLDCRFKKNDLQVTDTSVLVVNHTFGLKTLDSNETNVSGAQVILKNKAGTEMYNGYTAANGNISAQKITEYQCTASGLDFKTPHTLSVTNNTIENKLNIVIDAAKHLRIYIGGDSDLDGIPDVWENKTQVYWFEAEDHAYNDQQIVSEELASGSAAVHSAIAVGDIFNETVLSIPSGSYRYYVRARANSSAGAPTLRLFAKSDSVMLIPADDHLLTDQYQWFSTPMFTTTGNIVLGAKDISSSSTILVDKILLATTTARLGQITDPLQADTDNDWIIDGLEMRNTTWWIEAEQYPAISYDSQYIDDVNASNAKALSCTAGNQQTLNVSLPLQADMYMYYIRARNLTRKTGQVELKVNSTSLGTITVHEAYQWYSKKITISSAGTYYFTAKDTSGVRPAVVVDKILVVKLSDVVVDRLSTGNTSKKLLFPTSGNNDTAHLSIPADAMLTTATLELTGNFSQQRLTPNNLAQGNSDIFNDMIVYEDYQNGNADIYRYNLTTNSRSQITFNTSAQVNPAVYGNYIVWQDGRSIPPQPNVVANPGFETGSLPPWIFEPYTYFSYYVQASAAHTGSWGAKIIKAAGTVTAGTAAYFSQPAATSIVPGESYNFSSWIIVTLAPSQSFNAAIGVLWKDGGGTVISQNWSTGVSQVGAWALKGCTAVAPTGATNAEIRLRIICTVTSSATFQACFDDVSFSVIPQYPNWDIYVFNLSSSTGYVVTNEPSAQMYPDIYGTTIVWQDKRNGDWDIYSYDLSNGLPVNQAEIKQLEVGNQTADQTMPAIDDNRLVWQDNRYGTSDIFMAVTEFSAEVYDLKEIQITRELHNQINPAISGDRIVWQDDRNDLGDIYAYDLSGSNEKRITTNALKQENPAISGDKVVWQDSRNGNKDIYVYDFSSSKEKRITTNATSEEYPAIYGERIVWQDGRKGNADIYGINQYFRLDVCNNSHVDWNRSELFFGTDVTPNLADEINLYLAAHYNSRVNGKTDVPIRAYSNNAGNLTILNISLNIEYLTEPLDADTDGDGLNEGREIFGYFGYDILEAEDAVQIHEWRNPYADYTDLAAGDPSNSNKVFKFDDVNFIHQTGVTLTSSRNYTEQKEGTRDSSITLKTRIADTGSYKLIINPVLDDKENLGIKVDNAPQIAYKYVSEYAYVPVVIDQGGEDIQLNESLARYLRNVIANATYVIVEKENGGVIQPANNDEKEQVALSDIQFGMSLSGIQTKNVSVKANWKYDAYYNFTKNTGYTIKIGIDLARVPAALLPPGGSAVPKGMPWKNVSLARIIDVDCIRVERQTLNPLNIDADNDTLPDGLEATDSYYPLNPDADGDGLNDAVELYITNTSLGNRDSDYDGIRDAVELGWSKTDITNNSGEVSSSGSWRERIAHWNSAYNYTAINNYDANPLTTTDPRNPDTDGDGIPDGWIDGWTYQPNSLDPSAVKSYQRTTNLFKDVNYYRYDQTAWKFGGVMDCLVQIWEGEDLNLDGARGTNMSNWGFDGITYERLATTAGETDSNNPDTDSDGLPEGYEVWYSHFEPCTISDAGTPLDPTDDIYFLDPTKDDARFDKDISSTGEELYNLSAGNNWLMLNGAAVQALAQKIKVPTPVLYNISKISVHLNTMAAPKARMEIWSDWNAKPFACMATVDSYEMNGEGWCIFDVPDAVFHTSNLFGQPLNGFYIVMRWTTQDYKWKYLLGGGLPGDTFVQQASGNWMQTGDAFDYILYKDVYAGDNLTNLEEYIVGTNPKNRNTDKTMAWGADDGLSDGEEVGYRSEETGGITVAHQGFEGLFPPDGWSSNSPYQGTPWVQTTYYPFSGAFSAVCQPGETYEYQQEFLITEPFYLAEGDQVQLTFFQRSDTPGAGTDPVYVCISTTNTDPQNFTPIQTYYPGQIPEAWTQVPPIDLSAYAGSTIYLAWEYVKMEGLSGQNWYIDEMNIGGSSTVSHNRGGVIYRTNVANGSLNFSKYGTSGSWINYDGDGQGTVVNGRNYTYSQTLTDPLAPTAAVSDDNILLFSLQDGTKIFLNKALNKIYIWSPHADLQTTHTRYVSGVPQTYYEGICQIYNNNSLVNMNTYGPSVAYRNQEFYLSDPFTPDTDGDTIVDGKEIDWNKNSERNSNGVLIEADTLINVRDTDSDNDNATDGYELNWSSDTDADGLANMIDHDSDGDGIKDGDELNWNSVTDGDGLANMIDRDSDNDGILDGWDDANGNLKKDVGEQAGEDTNANGKYDADETSPIKYDTDDDGLWDGQDINVTTGYSWLRGNHLGEKTIHSFTGQTNTTNPLVLDTDGDTLSDGQEVAGWSIRVRNVSGNLSLVKGYSNPTVQYSDLDLLRDDVEYRFTNASNPDTDGDGLVDDKEDKDHSGSTSATETSPVNADTDGDGLIDGNINNANYPAEDRDNDGVLDNNEPNPIKADSDSDRVNDGNEYWSLKNLSGNGYCDSDNDGLIDLREYDSDNDGLSDGQENFNHDDKINTTTEADPTNPDTDGDGLLDGAETDWRTDSDNDGYINVRDGNSNDPSAHLTNDDYENTYVVFRTNAVDTDGDGKLNYASDTWVAVDPTGANLYTPSTLSLNGYHYSASGTSWNSMSPIYISYGPNNDNPIPVKTPDGYDVYIQTGSTFYILIKIGSTYTKYIYYTGTCEKSIHPIPQTTPGSPNYIANHQETYDGRPAVNDDSDFDGLSNTIELASGTNPNDADSDDDGVMDGKELSWNKDTDKDGRINALDNDSDGDGLFDGTEMGITTPVPAYGTILGTDVSKGNYTADSDPSTTTDPLNPDTDGDGLGDGAEDKNKNGKVDAGETDPLDKDTDDDGITDGNEVNGFNLPPFGTVKTDPTNPDTDGDGIFDGTEAGYTYAMIGPDTDVSKGHFVQDMNPSTTTNPADDDTDDDGILDGNEDRNKNGRRDGNDPTDRNSDWNGGVGPGETDPNNTDTDNDGLTDGLEIGLTAPQGHNTSSPPWNSQPGYGPDTDPSTTTDPLKPDSDGDGIPDGTEDRDKDGARDGNDPTDADSDWNNGVGPGETDPTKPDTDGDGLWDGVEVNGWDVLIYWEVNLTTKETRHVVSDPLKPDTDSDGVNDSQERSVFADPTSTDTDGDGIPDSTEWTAKSSLTGIEASPPYLTKAEIDIRVDYVETFVNVMTKGLLGWFLKKVVKNIPSGLYIDCEIEAADNVGVDSIWVKVDGESAQKQYGAYFYYLFEVDYDKYFLKGWNIDVEVTDVNGNLGEPERPLRIEGLIDKLYNLLSLGLMLILKFYGLDYLMNFMPDTDGDGLSDVVEKACFLNPIYPDIKWIDLVIAFNWDISNTIWDFWYMNDYKAGMRYASDFLFDVTDGHFAIQSVEFHDNVKENTAEWNATDIRVGKGNVDSTSQRWWPNATVGGITIADGYLNLPQYFEYAFPSGSNYYKTIVHEFGHYGLYLWDEYCNWDYGKQEWKNLPDDKKPPTFMNNQRYYTDPSTPITYLNTKYRETAQWQENNNESCWETIFRKYFTEPKAVAGAIEGVDYIWFDLERDGIPDYTFPAWYIPMTGPFFDVGHFVSFSGDHT